MLALSGLLLNFGAAQQGQKVLHSKCITAWVLGPLWMQRHIQASSSLSCLLVHVVPTGAKFYKPLSALLPAISAGMTYTPVTRADLAKGYPTAGWNEPAAAGAQAAPAAGPAASPAAVGPAPIKTGRAAGAALRAHAAVAAAMAYNQGPGTSAAAASAKQRPRHQPETQQPGFERGTPTTTASDEFEVLSFSSGERDHSRRSGYKQQQQPAAPRSFGPASGLQRRSSTGSTGGSRAVAGDQQAGLQQLLGGQGLKWRAILPSGDRVGPFSGSELAGWLGGGGATGRGRAPKGVDWEDAQEVSADPGSLKLCGIVTSDYSAQKLPGEQAA